MKKYYMIPVAACVAAVSLAPIGIHAQGWTKTFTAQQNLNLDYTFTVEFNDKPTEELIDRIVVVKGTEEFATTWEPSSEGFFAYVNVVNVEELQNGESYEIQVYLKNGNKYNMPFTTVAGGSTGGNSGDGSTGQNPGGGSSEGGNSGDGSTGQNPGGGSSDGGNSGDGSTGQNPGDGSSGDGSSDGENPDDIPNASPNKALLETALETYMTTTEYLALENSVLYQNAVELLSQYENALANDENVTILESQLTSTLSDVKTAIDKVKAINTQLLSATAIIEKGPYQTDDMQMMFDDYLMELEQAAYNWSSPFDITANGLATLITTLEKMATTDPEIVQAFITSFYDTLDAFLLSNTYLYLEDSVLYSNATEVIATYEEEVANKATTPQSEQRVKDMLATIENATKQSDVLYKELSAVATKIEEGPYQIEEMQVLFDEFISELGFEVMDWSEPAHIKADGLSTLKDELAKLAKMNPYKADLLAAISEVQTLLTEYISISPFRDQVTLEKYYTVGLALVTEAQKLSTSQSPEDDERALELTATLQEFVSDTEAYKEDLYTLNELYSAANEAKGPLEDWQTLFPDFKDKGVVLKAILNTIKSDLITKPYTDLSTNLIDYEIALEPYLDVETLIDDAITAEISKYDTYYSDLLDNEKINKESSTFVAFEEALNEAQFYDISDIKVTTDLIKKLRSSYKY